MAVRDGLAAVAGVPQRGATIGAFEAPVTLTILDWVTNLRLAEVAQEDLFPIIDTQVRQGKLKIQLRTIRFPADPDAEAAARLVQSAGLQGSFWQALAAFLPTYTGVIADDTAEQTYRAAEVPSMSAAFGVRQAPQVTASLDRADALALQQGPRKRPVYRVSKRDGSTTDISVDAARGRLTEALETAIKG